MQAMHEGQQVTSVPERTAAASKRALGPAAHRAQMRDRREQFRALVDLSQGHGLEIGPLDSGIADPQLDDVSYVDVHDTAGLREHYQDHENVILELIPEIDYPIYQDGQPRSLAEAARPGAPYDWVLASHVIEHVPDVVGWLRQIAELATPEAALLLAVPDRRYCFDRHRPATTTGQALQAYEEGHTRPSVRAVYDFFSAAVRVDTGRLWAGDRPPGVDRRIHDLAGVSQQVARVRAGEYVDCHVWTFTPGALIEHLREFRALGLVDWYVATIIERPGTVEFFALLRRVPADGEFEEVEPDSDLPDWLAEVWDSHGAGPRADRLAERLRVAKERVRRLRARVERLERKNRRLRQRLDAVDVPLAQRLRRGLARRLGRR
jgi:hypothetical protein